MKALKDTPDVALLRQCYAALSAMPNQPLHHKLAQDYAATTYELAEQVGGRLAAIDGVERSPETYVVAHLGDTNETFIYTRQSVAVVELSEEDICETRETLGTATRLYQVKADMLEIDTGVTIHASVDGEPAADHSIVSPLVLNVRVSETTKTSVMALAPQLDLAFYIQNTPAEHAVLRACGLAE